MAVPEAEMGPPVWPLGTERLPEEPVKFRVRSRVELFLKKNWVLLATPGKYSCPADTIPGETMRMVTGVPSRGLRGLLVLDSLLDLGTLLDLESLLDFMDLEDLVLRPFVLRALLALGRRFVFRACF